MPLLFNAVATVLTACGIETVEYGPVYGRLPPDVATVLTACGIETMLSVVTSSTLQSCNSTYRLRYWNSSIFPFTFVFRNFKLQQYLPLAVLKLIKLVENVKYCVGCNSTYRLRYWNGMNSLYAWIRLNTSLQQYLPLAVLKLYMPEFC